METTLTTARVFGGLSEGMRIGGLQFEPKLWSSALTLTLLGLLLVLGLWQIDRGRSKAAQDNDFAAGGRAELLLLEHHPVDAEALADRRVGVVGTFDTRHQFLLDNRTHEGRAGFHVLTPLRLTGGEALLVNRGWVPLGRTRDDLPEIEAPQARLQIQGRVSVPTANPFLLGDAMPADRTWPMVVQAVDTRSMESVLGYPLFDYLILLGPGEAHGFVRAWRPYQGIRPVKHYAYAFQWFSLAAALLVIYVAVNTRRIPRPPEARHG